MSYEIKPYRCGGYLFCMYELLDKNSYQIAEECGVHATTILNWLRKFNIKIKTRSEVMKGKKNPNYGRTDEKHPLFGKFGENNPSWRGDDIKSYNAIHVRAHKVQPKPLDGKCAICNQVADKKGITKLIHSNKDHTYRLPINPEEWHWVHVGCHLKYDWTPERKKEHSERVKASWTSERKKEQSEKWKGDNPIRRTGAIEKRRKTKEKNKANKSKKANKPKSIKSSSQVSYWLN